MAGQEWFDPSRELMAHIKSVMAAGHELPAPRPNPDRPFGKVTALAPAPELLDTLISANEAADLAGVSRSTIYTWKHRGHLVPASFDRRSRPLFRFIDVAKAESRTRARAGRFREAP